MDIDTVLGMMRRSYWWSPRMRRDVFERAISNSLVMGAFIDGPDGSSQQIGFARGVTDRATFAWLCDVFVDEAHRGCGIGRALVERLTSHPDVATVRRWCLATRDAQELYRTMDFVDVAPGRWMERRNPPSVWEG